MKPLRVCALGMGLAAAALAAAPRLAAQPNLHSLYVSVVNDAGDPVPGLGPSDFSVREDNVAREVLRVAPADEPMQIALLVDTSQQARDDISHIRLALPDFVTAVTSPNDSGARNDVAIVAFGERPTIFTDYTSNTAALQKGIDRIFAQEGSGAYLVDAIYETAQGFKKREALRPVMIAIAREGRELSYRQYDQVVGELQDVRPMFYALMLGTPYTDLTDEGRSRSIVLERGTALSGGHVDQLLAPMALPGRMKQLANQLTHQYRVTYSRPESLIPPEKITVETTRAGLTARGAPAKEAKTRP